MLKTSGISSFNPDEDPDFDEDLDNLQFEDESSAEGEPRADDDQDINDEEDDEEDIGVEALSDESEVSDDAGNLSELDDLHEHSSELDSISQEGESGKRKRKSKVQKMSEIASKHGYSGDFFNSNVGDFASAEDFEHLLDISDSELIQVHSAHKKKVKRK
jgi:hypothetical protein